jgi:hypothetical protein
MDWLPGGAQLLLSGTQCFLLDGKKNVTPFKGFASSRWVEFLRIHLLPNLALPRGFIQRHTEVSREGIIVRAHPHYHHTGEWYDAY